MSRLPTHREATVPLLDQAESLRALVLQSHSASALALEKGTGSVAKRRFLSPFSTPMPTQSPASLARSIVITSGKGGVGGSNLSLNLAIALGELGKRVVLVDADLGLANIDILCGLTPSADLGDVLTGSCTLPEALIEGPAGIKIIAGAHGMHGLPDVLGDGPSRLAVELAELESESDYLIIDAGSGLGSGIRTLAESADEVVLVTTPEPTSIADAQAALGRLRRLSSVRLRLVVNQARTTSEGLETLSRLAAGSREFFNTTVEPLGFVRFDTRVPQAVRSRRPFTMASPKANASRDIRKIADDLLKEVNDRARGDQSVKPGFFSALAARWASIRVSR